MGVTHDILEDRIREEFECGFKDIYKIFSECGKVSLRRNQMNLSAVSAPMAIWMGRIYLNQKESSDDRKELNNALGILDRIKELKIAEEE